MITKFFGNLFGRTSKPKPAEAKASGQESGLPKDEVIEGPTLPVEQGFSYTRAMGRRHNPDYPVLKADTLEHLWSGKLLSEEVGQARNLVRSDVRKGDTFEQSVEDLIALDQSPKDYDDRKGHVVVPSKGFEYHGDRESMIISGKGGRATKNGSIYTLETPEGLVSLDKESNHYNYRPNRTPETAGTDFSAHTKVYESGEFQISPDGVVTLPSASSLKQAQGIESQRNLAQSVQDEIEWANTVSSEAFNRVDGFENDHDPRSGHTVASNLDEYWFLRKCSLPHMQHQEYSIQSGPEGTRLYEDSYGKQPELMLNMSHEGDVTKLQAAAAGGKSLHVAWDKQAGTVKAELRVSANWVKPEPEATTPRPISRTGSRHDFGEPRQRDSDTGLPRNFETSGRKRSYGGGHHVMVKATSRFPTDQTYPDKFVDKESGKTYRKVDYRVLDGSTMYRED